MNAREQARFDMLKRVGTFGTHRNDDFTKDFPPNVRVTPAQVTG